MTSYKEFAYIYDSLMTDIPYDQYVHKVLSFAGKAEGKSLLDIGCGTGVLSTKFADRGFQVQAVDLSEEMLAMAANRFQQEGHHIPLFQMSMAELEGFHDIDVAIIAIDSLNYLEEEEEVLQTFKAIHESLKEGGLLMFDVHSLYKVDGIYLDGPFTFEDEEAAYIWHTEEGEHPHSVYHDLTFFIKTENGLYERFEESHFQRTYEVSSYLSWLKQAGFTDICITADWTESAPSESSERIFFKAVKQGS